MCLFTKGDCKSSTIFTITQQIKTILQKNNLFSSAYSIKAVRLSWLVVRINGHFTCCEWQV